MQDARDLEGEGFAFMTNSIVRLGFVRHVGKSVVSLAEMGVVLGVVLHLPARAAARVVSAW